MKVEIDLTRQDFYFLRLAYGKRVSFKTLVVKAVHEVCRREAQKLVDEAVADQAQAESKLKEEEPNA